VVHLRRLSSNVSADEGVQWVIDEGLLYDFHSKHEVYTLLAEMVPAAGEDTLVRLLEAVLSGPTGLDWPEELLARHGEYAIYNLLVWLSSAAPSWPAVQDAYAEFSTRHPEFGPRPNPDFDHYMETSWQTEPSDSLVDPLIARLRSEPLEALIWLLDEFEDGHDTFLRHETPAQFVAGAVAREPELGLRAWEAAGAPQVRDRAGASLRPAIVRGWTTAGLSEAIWREILAALEQWDFESGAQKDVAALLLAGVEPGGAAVISEDLLSAADSLSIRLWQTFAEEALEPAGDDWTTLGLNTWSGLLARYWIRRVSHDWGQDRQSWTGLDPQARSILTEMVTSVSPAGNALRAIIGRDLYFLFGADEQFTIDTLFPLLNWSTSPATAEQLWHGYLYGSRVNNRMLEVGLLEVIEASTAGVMATFGRGHKHHFQSLIVSICNSSDLDRDRKMGMLSSQVVVSRGEDFAMLISTIAESFDAIEGDQAVADAWPGWVREFIENLLDGIPRELTGPELSALPALVPVLGNHMGEAAELLLARPIELGEDHHWLYQLEENAPETMPQGTAIARLLTHLLVNRTQDVNPFSAYLLTQICPRLRELAPPDVFRALTEAALSHGVNSASSWV
jgi:hypothetical protein